MNTLTRRRTRSFGFHRANSEKGQAALAIILGVVLVMVTVPLVADVLVTGQQAVVYTSQNQTEALQAAQAGLVDFENHVAADAYYASPNSLQGYCSADGMTSSTTSFLNGEPFPGGGGSYNGCDQNMSSLTPPQVPSGQTDPNDPGFSNSFDPSCTISAATVTSATLDTSYAWDLYSGVQANGQENSEYQFIVDARAVTAANINAGDATAYVYVTGRAGSSGHYVCRSIKAAVNVLDPLTASATTTSAWGSPSINEPTPPPVGNQTVSFTITGASGAAGGNGLGIKGAAGGLGATVSGTFTAPADYPTAPYTSDPIYFGTWAGNAGTLGNKQAAGYDDGGAGGKDGGGGGASSVFCILPASSSPPASQTCTSSMPLCPAAFNSATGANLTQDATTGCIIAIAAGGGGGGEANLATFLPGAGGTGGASPSPLPTAGGNSVWNFFGLFTITIQSNGGGAAKYTAGGTIGNGSLFGFFPTANGAVGAGPGTVTSGGYGATYSLGTDGGGGGGGYWGGGGGGAGFGVLGAGGGGGGINWSQPWTNLDATNPGFTNGIAPAGTKNGTATLSVTTESQNYVSEIYQTGCTPSASPSVQVASPVASNATWYSVTAQLAGGGGGGAASPPEKSSTEPYGEPGGIGGYIGATNGAVNGTVTLNFNGTTGASSPPSMSYEIGCGGGGATAGGGSSTVAAGDNAVALNAAQTLKVASSTTFTTTGQVSVVTASGTAVLAYTGTGTGTLTGVTIVSGTPTWTLATGNAVSQSTVAGVGGGGFGAGGNGGLGKNTGTANDGADAGSGAGGGATALCLGTTCGGGTPTCTASSSGQSCAVAIAGGGGGGAEGTSDGKVGTSPAGPGGPGWGGGTNGSPTVNVYEPGASLTHYNYTWYWPDDSVAPTNASPASGTQNTNSAGMSDKSGNGTQGSFAPNTGGQGGGGGSQTLAGAGGASASGTGCASGVGGNASAGGAGLGTTCESAGGGGGGGYFGGGGGGGGTGGGYGGGGGSSYVYGYSNASGTASNIAVSPTPSTAVTPVTVQTNGTPFVPPLGSSATTPVVSYGAAGSGSTTTSTTAGGSGGAGQNGVLVLDWYYLALGQPKVEDTCTPASGVLQQGTGSNPLYTYFPQLGPTTFELSGGSGGSAMAGTTTPGASDVEYVTVNVQPKELFSYVEGCSGYLSLAGSGFLPGGSSGPTSSIQQGAFGGQTQYIGGTDIGGEAGGGGGASALCAGVSGTGTLLCNTTNDNLCPTNWTSTSTPGTVSTTTNCVLALAGGGGGAAAATWQNGATTACVLPNPNPSNLTLTGGTGGGSGTITSQTFNSGYITPGGNGGDEAYGGDNGSGTYSPTVTAYSSVPDPLPTSNNESSTLSQTVSSVTLFGTAGSGGGFEGGEPGQSYAGSPGPPVVVGCAGGGGSTWWLSVPSGNNSVTGSMTNPLTGTTTSTTGSGTVTIQGYNTNLTAERSSAVGATSW